MIGVHSGELRTFGGGLLGFSSELAKGVGREQLRYLQPVYLSRMIIK